MAAPDAAWKGQLRDQLLATRLTVNDYIMVGLATLDVLLLAVRRDLPLPDPWLPVFVDYANRFDLLVVAVFAVEFLVSVAMARDRIAFVKGNWYDLVGLIPIHSPFIRVFRLLRVVRVYVWGSRYPEVIRERFAGDPYLLHLLRRYEPVLVEELTDPLLIRLLGVLRRVVVRGRYANAVGEGLEARRDTIRVVVVDAIRKSPLLRTAYAVAPVKAGLDELEKQSVDVIVAALTDPRLDEVIRGALDDALAGLQASVSEKEWAKAST